MVRRTSQYVKKNREGKIIRAEGKHDSIGTADLPPPPPVAGEVAAVEVAEPQTVEIAETETTTVAGEVTTVSIDIPVVSGGNLQSGNLPMRIDSNKSFNHKQRIALKAILRAFNNSEVLMLDGRQATAKSHAVGLFLDRVYEALPDKG